MPVYEIMSADMARVKTRAPASFAAQVNDADIANALQARDFDRAGAILTEMMRVKLEAEGAHWMVGVKRLVAMSKATPV
jgi:protein transport protein SEC31